MFALRLKELRKEKGVTQEQLAAAIGVERSTVGKYESRHNPVTPSADILSALSTYFMVSIDYLLGKTNFKNEKALIEYYGIFDPYFEAQFDFASLIKEEREKQGVSLQEMSRYFGITEQQLEECEDGLLPLNYELAERMADYLGTNTSQLLWDKGFYDDEGQVVPEQYHDNIRKWEKLIERDKKEALNMGWEDNEIYSSQLSAEANRLVNEAKGCMEGDIKELTILVLRNLSMIFNEKREIDSLINRMPADSEKRIEQAIEVMNRVQVVNKFSSKISQSTDKICDILSEYAKAKLWQPFNNSTPPADPTLPYKYNRTYRRYDMKKALILIISIVFIISFLGCTNEDSDSQNGSNDGISSYDSGYEQGYLDATTEQISEEEGLSAYEDYALDNGISDDEISDYKNGYAYGYEKGLQQMEEEATQNMNDLKENWKDYPEFEDCEDYDEVLERIDSMQQ